LLHVQLLHVLLLLVLSRLKLRWRHLSVRRWYPLAIGRERPAIRNHRSYRECRKSRRGVIRWREAACYPTLPLRLVGTGCAQQRR